MASERAKQIVLRYEAEIAKAQNFRNLYQDTADLMYPRMDQITSIDTPGNEKTRTLFDSTAVLAKDGMTSGLSNTIVPPGQPFFVLQAAKEELNNNDNVSNWLSNATKVVHLKLFGSNFLIQLNETLRATVVFGTGCLYSDYKTELNFRDYDIASYVILENAKGLIDGILLEINYTARQAFELWGNKAGEQVVKAMSVIKNQTKMFKFIHQVVPRTDRNPQMEDSLNMPWESTFVSFKEKEIVEEGGFESFPFAVVRWTKASNEVWGRGQGTYALPDVRMLQQIKADMLETVQKHNNPPLEVLWSHDGEVRTSPRAINLVQEMGTIKAIQQQALGNPVWTMEVLEAQQALVKEIFFGDIFKKFSDLKGDRRNEFELRELSGERLQMLGPSVGRLWVELLDPLVIRTFKLCLKRGEIPPIPAELGTGSIDLNIDYIGRLAMELKSYQANGYREWVRTLAEIEQFIPGTLDIVNNDNGSRQLGHTFGVDPANMNSDEVMAQTREVRAKAQQEQQELENAALMAKAYGDGGNKAEEGSMAASVQEAVSG